MGLEPTTLGTTNRCSNQLSYGHRVKERKNSNLQYIQQAFSIFYFYLIFIKKTSEIIP